MIDSDREESLRTGKEAHKWLRGDEEKLSRGGARTAAAGGQVVVAQQLGQPLELVPRAAAPLAEQAVARRRAAAVEPVAERRQLRLQRRREPPQPATHSGRPYKPSRARVVSRQGKVASSHRTKRRSRSLETASLG